MDWAYFHSNPQIAFLADKANQLQLLREGLLSCKNAGISSAFMGAIEDDLVKFPGLLSLFGEQIAIEGRHTWMPEVQNWTHPGYQVLSRWLALSGTNLNASKS